MNTLLVTIPQPLIQSHRTHNNQVDILILFFFSCPVESIEMQSDHHFPHVTQYGFVTNSRYIVTKSRSRLPFPAQVTQSRTSYQLSL